MRIRSVPRPRYSPPPPDDNRVLRRVGIEPANVVQGVLTVGVTRVARKQRKEGQNHGTR